MCPLTTYLTLKQHQYYNITKCCVNLCRFLLSPFIGLHAFICVRPEDEDHLIILKGWLIICTFVRFIFLKKGGQIVEHCHPHTLVLDHLQPISKIRSRRMGIEMDSVDDQDNLPHLTLSTFTMRFRSHFAAPLDHEHFSRKVGSNLHTREKGIHYMLINQRLWSWQWLPCQSRSENNSSRTPRDPRTPEPESLCWMQFKVISMRVFMHGFKFAPKIVILGELYGCIDPGSNCYLFYRMQENETQIPPQ